MRKVLMIVVSILVLVMLLFLVFRPGEISEFTTNIDLENKVIDEGAPEGVFSDVTTWMRDRVGMGLMAFTGSWAYQNLAQSDARYIYIREGLRREEVTELFARHLDWDVAEQVEFSSAPEGMYY